MTSPFSNRALVIIVAVAAVSLGAAVALTVIGDDPDKTQPSAGADSYSVSVIGHRGLVEMLAKLDVPVVKSRSDSVAKATNGLLVVLEPTVSDDDSKVRLRALVNSAERVLVVLPKWYGSTSVGSTWIDDAHMLPSTELDDVLETLEITDTMGVSRLGKGDNFSGSWVTKSPTIRHNPQLVDVADSANPMVGDSDGYALVFAYERDDGTMLHVLTDPDVINNHGLRRPENARFAIEMIDALRGGGPVVIDEVIHGYARPPSLLRTLFEFPLVLATMQVLICAVLAVWAAMVRFGPRRAAPPPIAPGKDFLIQNTAALLHYGGHHADALRRYLVQSIAAVKHALHAPTLPGHQLTDWLERVRATRGGTISLVELERDAHTADTPQRTVEVADRVFRWRMEMINGPQHRS
ncbi:MAG TPA: DUF4350 domain-containing protein [Kofleriaceae bacterium]|nr:DUF4350 domain-containing protein [Kofleriaceae bacterium]